MDFDYQNYFAIGLGIYIYIRREFFVNLLLDQQKFARKYKSIKKLHYEASEEYLKKAVLFGCIFCISVGVLGFLGILHGPK